MNIRTLTGILIMLFVFGSSSIIHAQHEQNRRMITKNMDIKDLTADQEEEIKKLKLELEKEILPFRSEIEVKSAELKMLLISENPDQKTINKKIEEIGELRTTMQKLRTHHLLKIRMLLTPEQKVEFNKRVFEKSRLNKRSRGIPKGDRLNRIQRLKGRSRLKTPHGQNHRVHRYK